MYHFWITIISLVSSHALLATRTTKFHISCSSRLVPDSSILTHITDLSDYFIKLNSNNLILDQLSSELLANADTTSTPVCAAFGQPGWAPFCFLNGNPVFGLFDKFQGFIQSSVVSLHDILQA